MPANQPFISSANLASLEAKLKPVQRWLAAVPLRVWQESLRGLLVIWLAYVLVQAFWLIMPTPAIPPAQIMVTSTAGLPQSNHDTPNLDIEQLKKLTPFGNPAAEAVNPSAADVAQEAADTQLNLQLNGLVYSSDEKVARAVIISNGQQAVYGVGDPIPAANNASVAKILVDRVIINNNGKFESLWLYKDDPNAPRITQTYTSNAGRFDDPVPMAQSQPPIYSNESSQHIVPAPVEQNRMAQMGTTLSDVVAMNIHRDNGQIVGYKIRPGRNAEMFTSLGLQTDDVVTSVNGMPLNDPRNVTKIYRSMGTATSANLQILRNGSTVNLDISLNQ